MVRRKFKWFGLILLFIILFIASFAVYLRYSESGKKLVVGTVEYLIRVKVGQRLDIGDIQGTMNAFSIAHIYLSDEKGVWLKLRDVRVRWAPREKMTQLDLLSVGALEVVRAPYSSGPSTKRPLKEVIQGLSIPDVVLSRVEVGAILLPTDWVGAVGDLSLEASLNQDKRFAAVLQTRDGAKSTVRVDGRVIGDVLHFDVHWQERPLGILSLKLGGAFFEERFLLKGGVSIHTAKPSISLNSTVDLDDSRLSMEGASDFVQLNGKAQLDNVGTALLNRFGVPLRQGGIHGYFEIKGAVNNPVAVLNLVLQSKVYLGGSAQLTPMTVESNTQLLEHQLRSDVIVRAKDEAIGHVKLESGWPVIQPDNLLDARGEFDLDVGKLFSLFELDDHVFKGRLVGTSVVSGAITTPLVNGEAVFKEGYYQNLESGLLFDDIQLVARATDDAVQITQLTAMQNDAQVLNAVGKVVRGDNAQVSFEAQLSDAKLIEQDSLSVNVSGQVNVLGNAKRLKVQGDVTVSPVEINISENGHGAIAQLDVVELNKPQQLLKRGQKESFVDLDLTVHAPNRIFLRGSGLDAELGGDLRVSGTQKKPVIDGKLEVIRGRYAFLNKQFKLEQSDIRFKKERIWLNISAVTKAKDMVAKVRLQGEPEDIDVSLSSVPEFPQDEIVARILFGKDKQTLTPYQAIQLANVLKNLAGHKSKGPNLDLLSKTRDLLGVDVLMIGSDENNDTTVETGKYLSDKVYLKVEHGTKSQSTDVGVEVEVTPNISVETYTNSKDSSGGGRINWKRDY